MASQYAIGEFIPLYWDGDGDPSAYYVKGHVDTEAFKAAIRPYYDFEIDKPLRHSHARFVRAPSTEFDRELRESSKGRGAFPVTVLDVREHRGSP